MQTAPGVACLSLLTDDPVQVDRALIPLSDLRLPRAVINEALSIAVRDMKYRGRDVHCSIECPPRIDRLESLRYGAISDFVFQYIPAQIYSQTFTTNIEGNAGDRLAGLLPLVGVKRSLQVSDAVKHELSRMWQLSNVQQVIPDIMCGSLDRAMRQSIVGEAVAHCVEFVSQRSKELAHHSIMNVVLGSVAGYAVDRISSLMDCSVTRCLEGSLEKCAYEVDGVGFGEDESILCDIWDCELMPLNEKCWTSIDSLQRVNIAHLPTIGVLDIHVPLCPIPTIHHSEQLSLAHYVSSAFWDLYIPAEFDLPLTLLVPDPHISCVATIAGRHAHSVIERSITAYVSELSYVSRLTIEGVTMDIRPLVNHNTLSLPWKLNKLFVLRLSPMIVRLPVIEVDTQPELCKKLCLVATSFQYFVDLDLTQMGLCPTNMVHYSATCVPDVIEPNFVLELERTQLCSASIIQTVDTLQLFPFIGFHRTLRASMMARDAIASQLLVLLRSTDIDIRGGHDKHAIHQYVCQLAIQTAVMDIHRAMVAQCEFAILQASRHSISSIYDVIVWNDNSDIFFVANDYMDSMIDRLTVGHILSVTSATLIGGETPSIARYTTFSPPHPDVPCSLDVCEIGFDLLTHTIAERLSALTNIRPLIGMTRAHLIASLVPEWVHSHGLFEIQVEPSSLDIPGLRSREALFVRQQSVACAMEDIRKQLDSELENILSVCDSTTRTCYQNMYLIRDKMRLISTIHLSERLLPLDQALLWKARRRNLLTALEVRTSPDLYNYVWDNFIASLDCLVTVPVLNITAISSLYSHDVSLLSISPEIQIACLSRMIPNRPTLSRNIEVCCEFDMRSITHEFYFHQFSVTLPEISIRGVMLPQSEPDGYFEERICQVDWHEITNLNAPVRVLCCLPQFCAIESILPPGLFNLQLMSIGVTVPNTSVYCCCHRLPLVEHDIAELEYEQLFDVSSVVDMRLRFHLKIEEVVPTLDVLPFQYTCQLNLFSVVRMLDSLRTLIPNSVHVHRMTLSITKVLQHISTICEALLRRTTLDIRLGEARDRVIAVIDEKLSQSLNNTLSDSFREGLQISRDMFSRTCSEDEYLVSDVAALASQALYPGSFVDFVTVSLSSLQGVVPTTGLYQEMEGLPLNCHLFVPREICMNPSISLQRNALSQQAADLSSEIPYSQEFVLSDVTVISLLLPYFSPVFDWSVLHAGRVEPDVHLLLKLYERPSDVAALDRLEYVISPQRIKNCIALVTTDIGKMFIIPSVHSTQAFSSWLVPVRDKNAISSEAVVDVLCEISDRYDLLLYDSLRTIGHDLVTNFTPILPSREIEVVHWIDYMCHTMSDFIRCVGCLTRVTVSERRDSIIDFMRKDLIDETAESVKGEVLEMTYPGICFDNFGLARYRSCDIALSLPVIRCQNINLHLDIVPCRSFPVITRDWSELLNRATEDMEYNLELNHQLLFAAPQALSTAEPICNSCLLSREMPEIEWSDIGLEVSLTTITQIVTRLEHYVARISVSRLQKCMKYVKTAINQRLLLPKMESTTIWGAIMHTPDRLAHAEVAVERVISSIEARYDDFLTKVLFSCGQNQFCGFYPVVPSPHLDFLHIFDRIGDDVVHVSTCLVALFDLSRRGFHDFRVDLAPSVWDLDPLLETPVIHLEHLTHNDLPEMRLVDLIPHIETGGFVESAVFWIAQWSHSDPQVSVPENFVTDNAIGSSTSDDSVTPELEIGDETWSEILPSFAISHIMTLKRKSETVFRHDLVNVFHSFEMPLDYLFFGSVMPLAQTFVSPIQHDPYDSLVSIELRSFGHLVAIASSVRTLYLFCPSDLDLDFNTSISFTPLGVVPMVIDCLTRLARVDQPRRVTVNLPDFLAGFQCPARWQTLASFHIPGSLWEEAIDRLLVEEPRICLLLAPFATLTIHRVWNPVTCAPSQVMSDNELGASQYAVLDTEPIPRFISHALQSLGVASYRTHIYTAAQLGEKVRQMLSHRFNGGLERCVAVSLIDIPVTRSAFECETEYVMHEVFKQVKEGIALGLMSILDSLLRKIVSPSVDIRCIFETWEIEVPQVPLSLNSLGNLCCIDRGLRIFSNASIPTPSVRSVELNRLPSLEYEESRHDPLLRFPLRARNEPGPLDLAVDMTYTGLYHVSGTIQSLLRVTPVEVRREDSSLSLRLCSLPLSIPVGCLQTIQPSYVKRAAAAARRCVPSFAQYLRLQVSHRDLDPIFCFAHQFDQVFPSFEARFDRVLRNCLLSASKFAIDIDTTVWTEPNSDVQIDDPICSFEDVADLSSLFPLLRFCPNSREPVSPTDNQIALDLSITPLVAFRPINRVQALTILPCIPESETVHWIPQLAPFDVAINAESLARLEQKPQLSREVMVQTHALDLAVRCTDVMFDSFLASAVARALTSPVRDVVIRSCQVDVWDRVFLRTCDSLENHFANTLKRTLILALTSNLDQKLAPLSSEPAFSSIFGQTISSSLEHAIACNAAAFEATGFRTYHTRLRRKDSILIPREGAIVLEPRLATPLIRRTRDSPLAPKH